MRTPSAFGGDLGDDRRPEGMADESSISTPSLARKRGPVERGRARCDEVVGVTVADPRAAIPSPGGSYRGTGKRWPAARGIPAATSIAHEDGCDARLRYAIKAQVDAAIVGFDGDGLVSFHLGAAAGPLDHQLDRCNGIGHTQPSCKGWAGPGPRLRPGKSGRVGRAARTRGKLMKSTRILDLMLLAPALVIGLAGLRRAGRTAPRRQRPATCRPPASARRWAST